jgi:hypothetical protein
VIAGRPGLGHLPQPLPDQRMALCLEVGERELDIGRRQRCAIVKPRLGAQGKGEDQPISRDRHVSRNEPVHGIRLIQRAHHQ